MHYALFLSAEYCVESFIKNGAVVRHQRL